MDVRGHDGYQQFPEGFFGRSDEWEDATFYEPVRMVTHIDDQAIGAIGSLYKELGINGRVLDLMSSWISHFSSPPAELWALGMNLEELQANPAAAEVTVHDLNRTPALPYPDDHFDDVVCVVSVDYLTQPLEVFTDVARVLQPGGRFVCTFSNRVFATKAIRGWLQANDQQRCQLVASYFALTGKFGPATIDTRIAFGGGSDPLYAVWAPLA